MTTSQRRRKVVSIALGALTLVLFAALATLNAFHLGFLTPATTPQIFVYTALSALAFLLFVAAMVLLVRNVLKLYAEQRTRLLGVRLRTRMLWGSILVALVPIGFMFAFSYLLMNRAVDRWFSQPVTQVRDESDRVALELAQYTSANARAEAESIAAELPASMTGAQQGDGRKLAELPNAEERKAIVGGVGEARDHAAERVCCGFTAGGKNVAAFQLPAVGQGSVAQLKPWFVDGPAIAPLPAPPPQKLEGSFDEAILAAARRTDLPILSVGNKDFSLGSTAP